MKMLKFVEIFDTKRGVNNPVNLGRVIYLHLRVEERVIF